MIVEDLFGDPFSRTRARLISKTKPIGESAGVLPKTPKVKIIADAKK
jgi:hypothetical protein